jgi:hypothetical protein
VTLSQQRAWQGLRLPVVAGGFRWSSCLKPRRRSLGQNSALVAVHRTSAATASLCRPLRRHGQEVMSFATAPSRGFAIENEDPQLLPVPVHAARWATSEVAR